MADIGAMFKNLNFKKGALAAILENGGRLQTFWCGVNLHINEKLRSFVY